MSFTIEQLRGIPDAERSLIVVLAHALNEINTLNKLVYISTQFDQEPAWLTHAQAAQAFMLARPLAGKLHEAWAVFQRGYHGTKLSMIYSDLLEPSSANSLNFLKAYFSRSNLINEVRNSFAFHYSLSHAKTSIPDDASPDDLAIYLHESNGNSLYYFAEYLMNKALMEALVPSAPEEALGALLDEVSKVISSLNDLVQGLMFVIFSKHIGTEQIRESFGNLEVGPVPQAFDIRIPVFFELRRQPAGGAG